MLKLFIEIIIPKIMELFLENKELVSFEEWKKRLGKLKPYKVVEDEQECTLNVSKALVYAVSKRARNGTGILFSGGVDSTLLAFLCKKLGVNFKCCSVGLKNSPDLEWAKRIARYYDFDIEWKEYSLEEAEEIIKRASAMLLPKVSENLAVTVGVASVVIAAKEISDARYFFSGLGSEEIFAGYERHVKAEDINQECWNGLVNMWNRDLIRDYNLAKQLGIEVATPYLDVDLIKVSMQIPGKYKIVGGVKKNILRKAATNLGLDEEFAMRPKKAAQYGSGFDKAIEKLAKKQGLSKGEYLKRLTGKFIID